MWVNVVISTILGIFLINMLLDLLFNIDVVEIVVKKIKEKV